MEPNAIEHEDKLHAEMEGAYNLVMRDPRISDKCKKIWRKQGISTRTRGRKD